MKAIICGDGDALDHVYECEDGERYNKGEDEDPVDDLPSAASQESHPPVLERNGHFDGEDCEEENGIVDSLPREVIPHFGVGAVPDMFAEAASRALYDEAREIDQTTQSARYDHKIICSKLSSVPLAYKEPGCGEGDDEKHAKAYTDNHRR